MKSKWSLMVMGRRLMEIYVRLHTAKCIFGGPNTWVCSEHVCTWGLFVYR